MVREQIAFPVEKRKLLTEEEQALLADYKGKEKAANTTVSKAYYTGRIHAFYDIIDLIYRDRLKERMGK
ncbi:hypothetical protein NC661_07820 [Aquibacillus koreensis]|uniref:Uncharacterized protein n=1 Tax=Aquibacillus koreensis TaxID=279446 RepID=A0A9X3WL42_9BACI|nr:hypothetical protein [Aquibacillus koreensis]MCT2535821.1 hypothetical protein [Aquibacillus koreensis]MDC3420276.1 hypothetical protein [Aquibacillus koreensis]